MAHRQHFSHPEQKQSELTAELELLYSVFQVDALHAHERLLEDAKKNGKSGGRYEALLTELTAIANEKQREDLNRRMVNFLKSLFYSAINDYGLRFSERDTPMELCVAGSLARAQATAFSDIDCFLIFADDTPDGIKNQIKSIANKIFYIADGLFTQTRQFSMDPVGISLSKLNGSVKEIVEYILEQEPDGMGPLTNSVLNSLSVTGSSRLHQQLSTNLTSEQNITYESYFKKAFEFSGPKDKTKLVTIKSDLIRPVEFILQGLRTKENLSTQDYDTSKKILDELLRHEKISHSAKRLIEYLQSESYSLRKQLHDKSQKEDDKIENPNEDVIRLVDLVGWLRGSLNDYLNNKSEKFDLIKEAYLSKNCELDARQKEVLQHSMLVILSASTPISSCSQGEKVEAKTACSNTVVRKEFTDKMNAAILDSRKKLEIIKNLQRGLGRGVVDSGGISRITNEVESPYSREEKNNIADQLETAMCSSIYKNINMPDEERFGHAQAVFRPCLKKILIKYVFPQIFDESGLFQDNLWKILFSRYLGEKQSIVKPDDLHILVISFIQGYMVNIISADLEIRNRLFDLQGQLKKEPEKQLETVGIFSLFSQTMNSLAINKGFILEARDEYVAMGKQSVAEAKIAAPSHLLVPRSSGSEASSSSVNSAHLATNSIFSSTGSTAQSENKLGEIAPQSAPSPKPQREP